MENLIKKLKSEHKKLCKKIDSLEKFFQGNVYFGLTTYHKNLLFMQHILMSAYCNCLAQRILDIERGKK